MSTNSIDINILLYIINILLCINNILLYIINILLYINNILLYIDIRYGSVSDYLTSAGFTVEEQAELKSIFLEEP